MSFSTSLKRSLLEARKVFKILVLLSGEVSRKSSFFFSDELEFSSLKLKLLLSLVFLWGEGEAALFRSKRFSGELFRERADLSLAFVTVSSVVSFADLEGECSLIRVGLPGSIVM